jgi:hypothetical protein
VVAWRNVTVDSYNRKIRTLIYANEIKTTYGELKSNGVSSSEISAKIKEKYPFYTKGALNLPNILVGDILIANKPIFDENGNDIIYNTNEELIVTYINIEYRMVRGKKYTCYSARVKELFNERERDIIICHEDSQHQLDIELEKYRQKALKENNFKKRNNLWGVYYEIKKSFADLKYAPALTTYKSQGSTYENVIIIANDILQNRKKQELLQHFYVGVTRASKRCFVFL